MASKNKNFKTKKQPVKIRRSWGVTNPITKIVPDKKTKYSRAREKRVKYED